MVHMIVFTLISAFLWHSAYAQNIADSEHIFGGVPGTGIIHEWQGYVRSYDEDRRVPEWVAYKIKPDYRNTPKRKNRFKNFRKDAQVSNAVRKEDYNGLLVTRGYARGHLAPYGVMGGDRDGDGILANLDRSLSDADDEKTIFEGNLMSNIAPQHHAGFNGSPGLWFTLERWIQDKIVQEQGKTVWIFAGTIFGRGEPEKIGPDNDIHVPPMFYKIMIEEGVSVTNPKILAFLFPHQRVKHGEIQHFLVSIDVIEALTGLDFLNALPEDVESQIEDRDTWKNWVQFYQEVS